jgi:hypothetical protein
MKKQTTNNTPPKQQKKSPQTQNVNIKAKQAAKSIDTANKDANDVDRKSGM